MLTILNKTILLKLLKEEKITSAGFVKENNITKRTFEYNIRKINGILENFYGFMFRNQNLQGNFNMVSNQIAVADFMTSAEPTKTETKAASEPVKIPAFELNEIL